MLEYKSFGNRLEIFMSFRDWLTGDGVTNIGTEYSFLYWMTLLFTLLILGGLIALCLIKKVPYKVKQNVLVGVSIFHIAFEVLWRIVYIAFKNATFASLWPMYPCNLGGIIVPIVCLMNSKRGKDLFYVFGFVGACLSLMLPGNMYSYDFMAFPLFKSALQHTGILLIPAMEYAMGKYRPSIKDFPLLFVGSLVHIFNAEAIDQWIGLEPAVNDYMYLRQGYPFTIPGIPGPFVTCGCGLVVFALLLFILNPKQSINDLKELKTNIQNKFKKEEQQ